MSYLGIVGIRAARRCLVAHEAAMTGRERRAVTAIVAIGRLRREQAFDSRRRPGEVGSMTAPKPTEPGSLHHLWRWLTGQLDVPAKRPSDGDRHEPLPPSVPASKGRRE